MQQLLYGNSRPGFRKFECFLFSGGVPTIWCDSAPCAYHDEQRGEKECRRGNTTALCRPSREPVEFPHTYAEQLSVLRERRDEKQAIEEKKQRNEAERPFTTYEDLLPLLVDPLLEHRSMTMRICPYRTKCLYDTCTYLHSVDEALDVFARDAVREFYRCARLASQRLPATPEMMRFATPRHFRVRERDQFIVHSTPTLRKRCARYATLEPSNVAIMEQHSDVFFSFRLCDNARRLIQPEMTLSCSDCQTHVVIPVFI